MRSSRDPTCLDRIKPQADCSKSVIVSVDMSLLFAPQIGRVYISKYREASTPQSRESSANVTTRRWGRILQHLYARFLLSLQVLSMCNKATSSSMAARRLPTTLPSLEVRLIGSPTVSSRGQYSRACIRCWVGFPPSFKDR